MGCFGINFSRFERLDQMKCQVITFIHSILFCHFYVTEEERKLIRRKMIESKTKNMGAYLRKMAIDGYIVNTDTTPLKKQYEEMHKIGVNINQIAKKVNTTGDLYPEEMQELKEMVKELWRILRSSPLK
jgi:hypothetical protein